LRKSQTQKIDAQSEKARRKNFIAKKPDAKISRAAWKSQTQKFSPQKARRKNCKRLGAKIPDAKNV
jgi:transposase